MAQKNLQTGNFTVWLLGVFCSLFSLNLGAQSIEELNPPPPPTLREELPPSTELPESPRDMALSMQWSLIRLPHFEPSPGIKYGQVYGKAGPYLGLSLERFLLQENYGSLTAGGSLGFFYNRGSADQRPDSVTMLAFPMTAYTSYRMELVYRQLWIPFVKAGVGGWYYRQRSSEASYQSSDFAPMFFGGDGVDLLLDFFLWDYSKWVDQNFGINWTTISGEATYALGDKSSAGDISHLQINIGVRFDF